jgi:RHS repeat-associated protein
MGLFIHQIAFAFLCFCVAARQYGYDWAGRLTTFTNGAAVVTLTSDADGNRIRKIAGGTTTHYLVATVNPSGWPQVIEEHAGASPGTLSRRYTYGLDLISQTAGGATRFFGTDGLGSTRFLLHDTTGAVTEHYGYDAFGTIIVSNAAPSTACLFAGEQWDADLGLYYNRARYLHPGLGRFWTLDTFEGQQTDPLSLHKYLYAAANPVNNIDPSGHNFISTMSAAALQFSLQTINAVSRIGPVSYRLGYTVWRIQQHLWKIEALAAGVQIGAVLTDAGLGFLESSINRTLANTTPSFDVDGGDMFQRVVGANATGYRAIDHIIDEPDGRKTVVTLTTRGDTDAMSDDDYIRRVENRLTQKARDISTDRVFRARPGHNVPTIQADQVAGRIAALGIPETRAHLMSDPRMTEMLRRVAQAIPNVRSTIMPLRGWMPGRR